MKGNVRDAVRFAGRYIAILAVALFIIVTLVYMIAWMRLGQNETISYLSLLGAALPCMAVFVPLSVLAFMAGYCPEGSKDRMYIRLMMCIFTLFCIFYVSHSISYAIDNLVIDSSMGSYAKDIHIELDIRAISIILSLFPIISAIDSMLEYRQNRLRLLPEVK